MPSVSFDPRLRLQVGKDNNNNPNQHGVAIEEIPGLIKVYKDGHVERPPLVPNVTCVVSPELDITCKDVSIDKLTNVWARFYVPKCEESDTMKLPLLVYFHGGGFCVGSASWKGYHDFLGKLACKSWCVIMSVNYRLAPENRLPAAYGDGHNALVWVRQQTLDASSDQKWWWGRCNFSRVYVAGDSAGANIAYNVASRVGSLGAINPVVLKGLILIQPFFGGETRTNSERTMVQPPNSVLSLTSSDSYWRLSLPIGSNRDHPWCNPLAKGETKLEELRLPPSMVCIPEMDILKDRNLDFCKAMSRAKKSVEHVVQMGVGHAFQVLHNSQLSKARTDEMMSHIKGFIHR
ncbi:hypothetical protein GIB67_036842 [Kingdonia uniflora]|uniref:Alpha/beta hydrolase fold-3 domain-containing protein n=1 Tax=Kingdonia uniflora TaxID=39325 RepID=A0A7J7LWW5_9MAGN|nr:hypothetical protein GIB67_036842 [Kingdonia uniflora]